MNLTNTMNKRLLVAVPVGLVAFAALVLSVRSSVNAESVIGFASVFVLLGMAALVRFAQGDHGASSRSARRRRRPVVLASSRRCDLP